MMNAEMESQFGCDLHDLIKKLFIGVGKADLTCPSIAVWVLANVAFAVNECGQVGSLFMLIHSLAPCVREALYAAS